jgi:hypothetical protein
MTLDEAIAELYRREINCGCETFCDAGIRLFAESGQWLIDEARRLFPEAFVGPRLSPE